MPSIFAVANPKGGSGKTTVAIILAGEFAKHGYSAAIVDADPQGSSYQWHASSVARGLSPQGVDLVRAPDESALTLNWRVRNGSLTRLTYGAGRASLDSFNETAHLTEALSSWR